MANTYELIKGETIAAATASYTFSAIPSTYTDLVLKTSMRTDGSAINYVDISVKPNGATTGWSNTWIQDDSGTVTSSRNSGAGSFTTFFADTAAYTANTFANCELYIPNYAGNGYKVFNSISGVENNSTSGYFFHPTAGLWSNTTAITSLAITSAYSSNFVSGSSFYLYGIKKS